VVCREGLMFAVDPVRAAREIDIPGVSLIASGRA